ncbi:MAG: hemolysin family protein [Bacteroides sp.]|nr:hemolysin family protein [Eubacterium sp.]MCM1418958.1 hemolysin family protein [Roseburia sp.]MCM1463106.1 hemolysin family protein [Bacteroides sp.]
MGSHAVTLIVILVLVALSAFFSAAETCFTSVNRIRLKSRADEGSRAAARALAILARYDKMLTTILIGNNIVNILTSSLATVMCISLFGEDRGSLVSTAAVTVVVLIFGEILPKTIAKANAERFACVIGAPIKLLMTVITPLSAFFLLLQKGVSRLFVKDRGVSVTEQELVRIIDEIEDEGVLEQQESDLVRSALAFDETVVSEIITPRVNVTAVEINAGIDRVKELFLTEAYSRLPVYEKTIDHIVGFITQKDLFERLLSGESFYIRDIIQDTLHLPGLMRLSEALRQMQKKKIHLAVVVDQYGGTEGIVTLEDILEELVGEIWDENDEVTAPVKFLSETVFETSGEVLRGDFNRYFEARGLDFRIVSDSNTVGGWLFEKFGRIPKAGDTLKTDGFLITVKSLNEFRIGAVRFKILRPKTETEG